MVKKKKKNNLMVGLVIALLVIIPSIVFYFVVIKNRTIVGSETCTADEVVSPYCEGEGSNKIFQKTCVGGKWVKETVQVCSTAEQCVYGKCYPTTCDGAVQPYCVNDFEKVVPYCNNNVLTFLRQYCGTKDPYNPTGEVKGYCKDGVCLVQPLTCGDGICQTTEDKVSCYRDCGVINSKDQYYSEVAEHIDELQQYLVCDSEFDCKTSSVIQTADSIINKYNIPDGNPQMYMDAVIKFTHEYIIYEFGGGQYQCGESASDMIRQKWGNCVDYSVMSIALLRAKGIPARQVAGCVSHKSWFCHTFALRDQSKFGGVPILWDSSLQEETTKSQVVGGSVLGHSWIEVWLGEEKGWATADPTVGDTISKQCLGYYPVRYGGDKPHQDCETYGGQPCYTTAYCHIEGQDAMTFCKTY